MTWPPKRGERHDIEMEAAACCVYCMCHLYRNYFPNYEAAATHEVRAYDEDANERARRINEDWKKGMPYKYDPPYPFKHWNVAIARRCETSRNMVKLLAQGAKV